MSSLLTKETPIRRIYNVKPWPIEDPEDSYTKWYNSVIEKAPSELSPYDVVECLINGRFVDTAVETGLVYLTKNVLAGDYPGAVIEHIARQDTDTLTPYADILMDIIAGAQEALSVPEDNDDVWYGEKMKQILQDAVQSLESKLDITAEDIAGRDINPDFGSGWKTAERAAVEERETWHAPQYEPDGNCPPEFRRYVNSLGVEYIALYGDDQDYWKYDAAVTGFHGAGEILYGDNGLYNAVKANDIERMNSISDRLKQAPRELILPGGPPEYVTTAEQLQEWLAGMNSMREWLESTYRRYYYSLPIMPPDMLTYILEDMSEEYVIFFDVTPVEEDPSLEPMAKEAIRLASDRLSNLRRIFVYNEDMDKASVMNLMEYPRQRGIDVQVPGNHYKMRKNLEDIRKRVRRNNA